MIMFRCGMAFFVLISLGISRAFSAGKISFVMTGDGAGFSSTFANGSGGIGFSSGAGKDFSSAFTGDSGITVFSPEPVTDFFFPFAGVFEGAFFSPGTGAPFSSAFTGSSARGWVSGTPGVSGTAEWGDKTGVAAAGGGGAATGLTSAPQVSQNFTPGASNAPHFGQAGTSSIFAPQDSQNFIPGVTGLPHFWQVLGFAVMDTHFMDLAQ
jgi:hypothetical protein